MDKGEKDHAHDSFDDEKDDERDEKEKCEKEKYEKEKYEKDKKGKYENVKRRNVKKGKYDALVLALFPAGQPPISKNCLLTSAKLFHQDHHDHNHGNGYGGMILHMIQSLVNLCETSHFTVCYFSSD